MLRAQIRVDGQVLLFGIGLALLTGLGFGLLPALRSTRVNLAGAFKAGGRSTESGRGGLRSALVVVEVALALILLVSAGLMLKSLGRLLQVDKGFDAENVLTAAVGAPADRIPNAERWRAFYHEIRTRAIALPEVQSVSFQLLLPLAQRSWELRIHPEGVPPERETGQSVLYNIVSPEYFATFGIPLLRGRGFGPADQQGAELVAIIDETMAERFWPGQDAIGRRVTFETETEDRSSAPVYRTIVGVAKNVRHYELVSPSRIQVYVPMDQSGRRWGNTLRIALKTSGPPDRVVAPLRAAVAELDPDATTVWGLTPSLRSCLTERLLIGRAGNAAFLSYAPRAPLTVLLMRLLRDPRVSLGDKGVALLGLVYVLSPIDLLPEVLLGPIGLLDDLFVVAATLSRLLNHVHPDVALSPARQGRRARRHPARDALHGNLRAAPAARDLPRAAGDRKGLG